MPARWSIPPSTPKFVLHVDDQDSGLRGVNIERARFGVDGYAAWFLSIVPL